MKSVVYDELTSDAVLQGLVSPDNWLGGSTVTSNIDGLYVVIRWGERPRGVTGLSGPIRLQLWVYDTHGSYDNIDAVLDQAEKVISGIEDVHSASGNVACATWERRSAEFDDPERRKIMKYSEFTVIGR